MFLRDKSLCNAVGEYFRNKYTTYNSLAQTVLNDNFLYNKSEITKIMNKLIDLLKKYDIYVILYDSLILFSKILFYQIKKFT